MTITDPRKDVAHIAITESPDRVSALQRSLVPASADLQDWLRHQFAPYYDTITVTPYVIVVEDKSQYGLNTPVSELQELLEPVAPGHAHNYFVITNVSAGGAGGRAWPNSYKMVVTAAGAGRLVEHEAGHAIFDGRHYVRSPLDEPRDNYGGPGTLGSGSQLAAPYLHNANLMPADFITDTSAYLVEAMTWPGAIPEDAKKIIYVEWQDRVWGISFLEGRVRVDTHRGQYKQDPPWGGANNYRNLLPGDTWEFVDFLGIVDGMAKVQIKGEAFGPAPAMTPEVSDVDATEVAAGSWFSDDAEDQGLFLYVRGDEMYGDVFTFDKSGKPTWLEIGGKITDGWALCELRAVDPKTRERVLVPVGRAMFSWTDENTMTMWCYIQNDDWAMSRHWKFDMRRLTYALDHPLAGLFGLGDGEGIALQVSGDKVFGIRYYYDAPTPYPRWQQVYGDIGEVLEITEPVGGFIGIKGSSVMERWGEAKIAGGKFYYRRDGWDDWKVKDMNRLIDFEEAA